MDESLSRGLVECIDRTEKQREQIDHPHLDEAGIDQCAKHEREKPETALCDEKKRSLFRTVDDASHKKSQCKDGRKSQRHNGPERDAGAGEAQEEPAERDRLHPIAYVREIEAKKIQPVIPDPQRRERLFPKCPQSLHLVHKNTLPPFPPCCLVTRNNVETMLAEKLRYSPVQFIFIRGSTK